MWRVVFDEKNTVCVTAPDSFQAAIVARFQAWSVTGKWMDVKRVELVDGDAQS